MKLQELTDDHGTTLQSYADLLLEKCHDRKVSCILVFSRKDDSGMDDIAVVTSVRSELVPLALAALAKEMTGGPPAKEEQPS